MSGGIYKRQQRATQKVNEQRFVESLEKTLYMSHSETEVLNKYNEDRAFLQALGHGRMSS